MKLRLGVPAVLLAIVCALVVAPTVAAAPPAPTPSPPTPVTGTFASPLGTTGAVAGTFSLDRVVAQSGGLLAVGNLTATLTDALGNVVATIDQTVTVPLAAAGSCSILDLTLGPLHLDVLGLVVDLNQVHLQVTAQSGPGNLLGNLLCAVTHLLDGNASGNALSIMLNRILGLA